MKQCKATNKNGLRCRNTVTGDGQYCHIHKNQDNSAIPALAIGGAILGNLLFPGVGGAIAGGIIGGLLGASSKRDSEDE